MVKVASELVISLEFPTAGFRDVLTFPVSSALLDGTFDTVTELVHDLAEELCEGGVKHHEKLGDEMLEGLRSQAKAHLEEWEGKLAAAQELKVKGERAVQNLKHMRETYYKELSSYRQQLSLKSKAEANGEEFHAEPVNYFDPTEYVDDELASVLSQKVEIMEQNHKLETRRLLAQIDALTEQVSAKSFFLNAKDELVSRWKEDIVRRDSVAVQREEEDEEEEEPQEQGCCQSDDTTDEAIDIEPPKMPESNAPKGRAKPKRFSKGPQAFVARKRPAMAEANVGTDPRPVMVDSFTQSDVDSSVLERAAQLCAQDAEDAWQRLLNCQDSDSDDGSVDCDKVGKIDTDTTMEAPELTTEILGSLWPPGASGDCDLANMFPHQPSFESISHQHVAPTLVDISLDTCLLEDLKGGGAKSDWPPPQACFQANNNFKPEQRTVGVQVEADLIFSNNDRLSLESVHVDPSKMTVAQLLHRHSVTPQSPELQAKRRPRALHTVLKKPNDALVEDNSPPLPPVGRRQSEPAKAFVRRPSTQPVPPINVLEINKGQGSMEVKSMDTLPAVTARTTSRMSMSCATTASSPSGSPLVGPNNSGLSINSSKSNGSNNNNNNNNNNNGVPYMLLIPSSDHGAGWDAAASAPITTSSSLSPVRKRSLSFISFGSEALCDEVGEPVRPGSAANSERADGRSSACAGDLMSVVGEASTNDVMVKPPSVQSPRDNHRRNFDGSEVLMMPTTPDMRSTVRWVRSDTLAQGEQSPRPQADKGRQYHRRPSSGLRTTSEPLPHVCTPNNSKA